MKECFGLIIGHGVGQAETEADFLLGGDEPVAGLRAAPVLQPAERDSRPGEVRYLCGADLSQVLRDDDGPSFDRAGRLLPLLSDGLLRGDRLRARDGLPGLGLAQSAGVPGLEPGGADAGPLDAVQDAAADEPGDAQSGVPVGAEAAGGGGLAERKEPGGCLLYTSD